MNYSFLDLAKEVLKRENIPLSAEEMWELAGKYGLWEKLNSSGKTPIRTLSARIYVDIKNNENSCFTQVSNRPAKFFLKDRIAELAQYEEKQEKEKVADKHKFKERDLHILLSSFVRADELKCLTKTI